MRVPIIQGVIDRRLLLNYRATPEVVADLLPPLFRPKLHRGFAMVGICLIRLRAVRPRLFPAWVGVASENAAHRVAVQWDDGSVVREGVYIRRRDTSSWFNTAVGGRLFPGIHHRATFNVRESESRFECALQSADGETSVAVVAEVSQQLPSTSVFTSLVEASAFFEAGALGYSATSDPQRFQGLELRCQRWSVEPLSVSHIRSSYFEDRTLFPKGSITFDCGLLMRGVNHEWHGHSDRCWSA